MADIIWGTVGKVVSGEIFELNVSHQKDGNKNDYSNTEKIKFVDIDIPTIPLDPNERSKQLVEENLGGKFVKCEIKEKGSDGYLVAKVSHSGQGGY